MYMAPTTLLVVVLVGLAATTMTPGVLAEGSATTARSGTLDFIFGDARAVFQDSHIYARQPATGHDVVVIAQGRFEHDGGSGFVFQNGSATTSP